MSELVPERSAAVVPELSRGMRAAASSDEPLLLDRLRSGCETAYRQFVAEYGGRLLATARGLLRNEEDAQDAVQEAFLSAFKALASFDGRCRLATWLHRIVVNASLMKLRARQSRRYEQIEELLPDFVGLGAFPRPQIVWDQAPEEPVQREELTELVLSAIASLPDSHRTPLLLRDIEGRSNQELAAELGISVNAAKIRVHRARQALRELLAPRMESLVC